MPVDGVLPTVPVVCVAFRRKAGSKHWNVTLCDVLYQFYEAVFVSKGQAIVKLKFGVI
ncbi:MAG: hypothetical protein F6K23_10860 [Okeania sp. SIO2C9]|uniref:hypothetical protein n=1 Tax=Okeania sp. SIO2C9 TaxID=2607791 RepID=UPI0013C1E60E|nr:hypothetical protein [Okeania sp. SIO2C9]NEQ73525.1 hypothetical protein [Okeania sp. SIO2C9]